MKKMNLILITILFLIVGAMNVNAWINCTPANCSYTYNDSGVSCIGGECIRSCTADVCSDDAWTNVYSDSCYMSQTTDELSCTTSSYTPTNTSRCYNFTLSAAEDFIAISVVDPPQNVSGMDCDSHAWAGFQDSSWFDNLNDYLEDVGSSRFNYKLEGMYSHTEADDTSAYRNTAKAPYTVSCAPSIQGCEDIAAYNVTCDTDCYNNPIKVYFYQGYQKDYGDKNDKEDLYYNAGCLPSNVNGQSMYYNYFRVYYKPTYTGNDDQTCDRTNEAPNASNAKVLPENATTGDDLICNFTYYDIEGFEEKDSTFDWRKNGISQNINSQILGKGNLSINDKWLCEVIPSDGLLNGTKAESSNITILSTVQNPKMYIEDSLTWSYNGYYSISEYITDFVEELNDALENCAADEEGYCNISITFSSDYNSKLNISNLGIYYEIEEEVSSLTISSLNNISINNTQVVFEFIILNNGDTNLNNINWTIDFGDGNTAESLSSLNLTANEDIFVFVEHNYSSTGTYTVVANASSGNATASKNETIEIGSLIITSFDDIDINRTVVDLEVIVINNQQTGNITNINWTLDMGDGNTIFANKLFNLTPDETIFIYIRFNYTRLGEYTVTAEVTDGTNTDSETISIDVKDIKVANLTVLDINNTKRIFEFFITNNLNNNLTNVSWRFDTKNNFIINSTENTLLTPNEKLYVYVDYNYTQTGTYNVNATAINGSLIDSRNITINVS